MHEQLTVMIQAGEFLASVSNNIDALSGVVDHYLSGTQNLRLASIILMLLAFLLFLFLIIILYVKSIVSFLKTGKTDDLNDNTIFDEEDEERLNQIMEEQERERELEKELQKELELARAEKEMLEQTERRKQQEQKSKEKERKKEKTKEREKETERKSDERQRGTKKTQASIDLDWKKGKLPETAAEAHVLNQEFLSYRQSQKDLSELLGLVIDMLARGVDDLKIAQTVMFRNQGKNSEDDILQMIESTKDFIGLCINGNFDKLPADTIQVSEADALYHLALGDPTLSLSMIEQLMDYNIELGGQAVQRREEIFRIVSNYACTFGNLAAINDLHLATGAFELAIELNPSNINAWSRLGDMYTKAASTGKAIWAYNNVLNQADEDLYMRQVANANKMMSQYLYDQGNSLQAAKLYNSSKQYYDSLGINRRLDKQELEIIEIIESHQQNDLQQTIQKLLERKNVAVYAF